MDKGTSEIVKLTERISKDPKSKLFVPLAEEYKKAGDIEMAVHVLLEGLKHNSGYVTARSFLARLLMEKGDLIGAQKEFEEVVKAIPDNLLAQKKLGDLYALQNNQSEALKHYKIVVALNPGDEDLVSMVADLESGIDVSQRLRQQKAMPSSGPAGKPGNKAVPRPVAQATVTPPPAQTPEPAGSATKAPEQTKAAEPIGPESDAPATGTAEDRASGKADLSGAAGSEETKATAAETEPGIVQQAARPAGTEQEPASPAILPESEEPEDVLVVEPLDEEIQQMEVPSSGPDLFAGAVEENGAEAREEEQTDALFAAQEPPGEELPLIQEVEAAHVASAEIAAAPAEEPAPSLPEQEPAIEQKADQSDDFTTDTLAELYIAQGFFEKAIDIYQRMLADRPDSRGLKDKLERVKAMAVAAVEPSSLESPAAGIVDENPVADIFSEPSELIPPVESTETGREGELIPGAEEVTVKEGIPSGPVEHPAPATGVEEDEITIEAEIFVESGEEAGKGTGPAGNIVEDNIFAEPLEYKPTAEAEPVEGPSVTEEKTTENSFDIFTSPMAKDSSRVKPLYSDFEPREYIPPAAEPRPAKEAKMTAALKQPLAGRKETIDRLENWLKNIIKEK